MKKVKLEEFVKSDTRKGASPHAVKARELVEEFLKMGEDIVEIEEKDFDDELKFDDVKDKGKVTSCLRNAVHKLDKGNKLRVKQRGNRIFLGKREVIDPNSMKWRR